jgi:hypothetical protein
MTNKTLSGLVVSALVVAAVLLMWFVPAFWNERPISLDVDDLYKRERPLQMRFAMESSDPRDLDQENIDFMTRTAVSIEEGETEKLSNWGPEWRAAWRRCMAVEGTAAAAQKEKVLPELFCVREVDFENECDRRFCHTIRRH